MKYGCFDSENREYVIERVDVPVSWTNYLGVRDMCAVVNQTAGGYLFYKSPEYHRMSRFRPNGVPLDRPGHYVYLRDDDTGEFWSVSWQPVGKPLAHYTCRHGLSYSRYLCDYSGINAEQTLFIPLDETVELWDVRLTNASSQPRNLSVFGYCEFSFRHIDMDNKNLQMSLYSSGSDYKDGMVELCLFYENAYQFFATDSSAPDGFDSMRDSFLGVYHDESSPIAVDRGRCSGSKELGGNHCGALQRKITLRPGESARLLFLLGEGSAEEGARLRRRYAGFGEADAAFAALRRFWDDKLAKLEVRTPNKAMNEMLNVWTLYQSEINVIFSRFASFIEVGGRTGLGYRDTAQDAMTVPHSNPGKCKSRIVELLRGLTTMGYGLHLFDPAWFEENPPPPFKSPTVVPTPEKSSIVHGLKDACADDALWLVASIVEYIRETGELAFADEVISYADGGSGTVYEHMLRILEFSAEQVGPHGICRGLRADWNDCLNLGAGESSMVSFLHHWALTHFVALAGRLGREEDAAKYAAMAKRVAAACKAALWDEAGWYVRGITASGRKIGTGTDKEGRVHMESNTWAVLSGVADREHGISAMDAVDEYLYTPYGLMLCAPAYSTPDDEIGFVTRVYKGVKENGAIFSHSNPWAWCAEAMLGRGGRAMKFYDALCPYNQNDRIEIRESEPYSYCQFVMGRDHTAYGRARHPFMTGSGGWSYYAATKYILGVRPDFDELTVDPCIPADWENFSVTRQWRGATYRIKVENPGGVEKGVRSVFVNGERAEKIPVMAAGTTADVRVVMGQA